MPIHLENLPFPSPSQRFSNAPLSSKTLRSSSPHVYIFFFSLLLFIVETIKRKTKTKKMSAGGGIVEI
jgi:hypothetical protein